jgi:hypothetical protein
MEWRIFQSIPEDAPLIVVEAVWQYSHHVSARLGDAQGADSHGGELEWPVAGLSGHVESEWFADQSGRALFDSLV